MKKAEILFRNKYLLLIPLFLIAAGCAGETTTKIKMELPRPALIDADAYHEIAVTDFLIKDEEKPDFDLNAKIVDYFSEAFRVKTRKETHHLKDIPLDDSLFQNPDFWKKQQKKEKRILIATGSASFQAETRKALTGKDTRQFKDPFPEEKRLMERNFFNLKVEIFFIDPDTGEIIYQRQFDEKKATKNPNQTGAFAFYDLIIQIKDKLFRQLFGLERVQERYLIMQ